MPLNRKWRSMDFFGSHENLNKGEHHSHHHHGHHLLSFFRPRLGSFSGKDEAATASRKDKEKEGEPPDTSTATLVQRCVIIQRDEKGYGFTVSGDNPVYVASVKLDGAAARAGVQQGDRIIKVNGTLVTSRNHMDVVKLIKSGSYVALTLLGKPPPAGVSTGIVSPANIPSNRESVNARVTAPQPVDPDKDKELWQQKVHMTRAMFETAKEDFEKIQRQYVRAPSEKLHAQLLDKEKTVKALDNQLKQLTGGSVDDTPIVTAQSFPHPGRPLSETEHLDSSSLHTWAGTSDLGSMSDSPQTSPSVSPTPTDQHRHNGEDNVIIMDDSGMGSVQSHEVITMDDDVDIYTEDSQVSLSSVAGPLFQLLVPGSLGAHRSPSPSPLRPEANDPGPFADIRLLEKKPAHMAILLNYLISNSDPSPVFFYIVSDIYSHCQANVKELRKWAFEIYSTFVVHRAPLKIGVEDSIIGQIDSILTTSAGKTDNESTLRSIFESSRQAIRQDIAEMLADFRNKKDLGLGNLFGVHELGDSMDRAMEIRTIEKYLLPHLDTCGSDDNSRNVSDRDQAQGWAIATFMRHCGATKSSQSAAAVERVQSFMMKDKRSLKFPGSRSSRAKQMKGHQFNLQHFYTSSFCNFCGGLIWGVGYQGYQCQSCEMTFHKQCVEEITDQCVGKAKRGDKKRGSHLIPVINTRGSRSSNSSQQIVTESVHPHQGPAADSRSPSYTETSVVTTPLPRNETDELASALSLIAGLPTGHSVKSIVNRYHELTSPTSGAPAAFPSVPATGSATDSEGRGSTDLTRSGSLNNKGEKGDRPARRAKSDVEMDDNLFKTITQSGSSSASSLSNRSAESPSNSTDNVNDVSRAIQEDSDLEAESELPPLKQVLDEDVLRKLKPKEKKRQEVLNELFHTERQHLRNLKIIDLLFNRPMLREHHDLARALFPNIDEMILLHSVLNKEMKEARKNAPNKVVKEVGEILLRRFDGENGDTFRKACAEYCRNQSHALEALKKQTRKEPRFAQFLMDAESNILCRRLQLKDLVPSQMQRLTKYPLLIENLLKYTPTTSDEYSHLERAHDKCKAILGYVNHSVLECENYHKLKDMQKRLDRKPMEGVSDPSVNEIKTLDLTQHKLVYDGPLVWKLRTHRMIDLHVLLFEDMLVLLQRQDDRYVLKCQNMNVKEDSKYTHVPVLRLKNLLARNLATDKKSFFVVNILESKAQMYEFMASSSESRIRWCKLINDRAEQFKKGGVIHHPPVQPPSIISAPPSAEAVEEERPQVKKESSPAPGGKPPSPGLDQLSTFNTSEEELIQPDEVSIANPVTAQATPMLAPLDISPDLEETSHLVSAVGEAALTNPLLQEESAPQSQQQEVSTEQGHLDPEVSGCLSAGVNVTEETRMLQALEETVETQIESVEILSNQPAVATESPTNPTCPSSLEPVMEVAMDDDDDDDDDVKEVTVEDLPLPEEGSLNDQIQADIEEKTSRMLEAVTRIESEEEEEDEETEEEDGSELFKDAVPSQEVGLQPEESTGETSALEPPAEDSTNQESDSQSSDVTQPIEI